VKLFFCTPKSLVIKEFKLLSSSPVERLLVFHEMRQFMEWGNLKLVLNPDQ